MAGYKATRLQGNSATSFMGGQARILKQVGCGSRLPLRITSIYKCYTSYEKLTKIKSKNFRS
ncbi:MAG TPA: hypothetical protein PLX13_13715 [Saprospiraceae bacterium]|nr:hypothetical protein [Saprospiraceae bacterium]